MTTDASQLNFDLANCQRRIHRLISTNYPQLLQLPLSLQEWQQERIQQQLMPAMQQLKSSADRVLQKVEPLYSQLEAKCRLLEQSQRLSVSLRAIQRVATLQHRLFQSHQQFVQEDEVLRIQWLTQLESLLQSFLGSSSQLRELEWIQSVQKWTVKYRQREVEGARSLLEQGLLHRDTMQLNRAFRAFQMLDIQQVELQRYLDQTRQRLVEKLASVFSPAGSTGQKQQQQQQRDQQAIIQTFWQNLVPALDQCADMLIQSFWLERALLYQKRDDKWPSIMGLNDHYMNSDSKTDDVAGIKPWECVWTYFGEALENQLRSLPKNAPVLMQLLQGSGYPRFLKLILDQFTKLSIQCNAERVQRPDSFAWQQTAQALQFIETAYLTRSLARLFDPINLAFTHGNRAPNRVDLMQLLKIVNSELELVRFDVVAPGRSSSGMGGVPASFIPPGHLLASVLKNISKALSLYTNKLETLIVHDAAAHAVVVDGIRSTGQSLNFDLFSGLLVFTNGILESVRVVGLGLNFEECLYGGEGTKGWPDLPAGLAALKNAFQQARKTMGVIMDPLFSNVAKLVSKVMMRMHQEEAFRSHTTVSVNAAKPAAQAQGSTQQQMKHSRYLNELGRLFNYVEKDVLNVISQVQLMKPWIHQLCQQTIRFFLWNASLLRLTSSDAESGKLQLANDMAQIEFVIGNLCGVVRLRLNDLGSSYESLRSYRPLLFLDISKWSSSPLVQKMELIPLVHTLFSNGPPHFVAPHVHFHLSLDEYIRFLVEKTEQEWINGMVSETARAYCDSVEKRGEKEYCPEYSVLLKVLASRQGTSS